MFPPDYMFLQIKERTKPMTDAIRKMYCSYPQRGPQVAEVFDLGTNPSKIFDVSFVPTRNHELMNQRWYSAYAQLVVGSVSTTVMRMRAGGDETTTMVLRQRPSNKV